MLQTIGALLDIYNAQRKTGPMGGKAATVALPATNTKTNMATSTVSHISASGETDDSYNNYFKSVGIHFQKPAACFETPKVAGVDVCDGPIHHHQNQSDKHDTINRTYECKDGVREQIITVAPVARNAPKTLELFALNNDDDVTVMLHNRIANASKKRKLLNTRYNLNQLLNEKHFNNQFQLNEIVEECGYDSDIGKFNCKPSNESSLTSDSSSSIELPIKAQTINDEIVINNLNSANNQAVDVLKKDYGEKFNIPIDSDATNTGQSDGLHVNETKIFNCNETADYSSILCLTAFFTSAIWLYLFPLPS